MQTGSYRQRAARRTLSSVVTGPDARRALGRHGEDMGAAHLRRRGFALVARNQRTRHGEIDLIAFDGRTLVFCEVKCRRASAALRQGDLRGQPLSGLGARQRARLRRLAAAWLADSAHARPAAQLIRFDAIGVTVDAHGHLVRLEHIEGAW